MGVQNSIVRDEYSNQQQKEQTPSYEYSAQVRRKCGLSQKARAQGSPISLNAASGLPMVRTRRCPTAGVAWESIAPGEGAGGSGAGGGWNGGGRRSRNGERGE